MSDLTDRVRERYGAAARRAQGDTAADCGCACGDTGCWGGGAGDVAMRIGYSADDVAKGDGSNLGLGCGNPLALAAISPGATVLDLGSGAGFDAFLAAERVGPSGRVLGVDVTPDMLALARRNAAARGATNVEFREGRIDALPVDDASVDLVISNCVVNLAPDKPRVFREIARVLKPGGTVSVSDLVLVRPLPETLRESVDAHVGCVAGASPLGDYVAWLAESGLADIAIPRLVPAGAMLGGLRATEAERAQAEAALVSATFTARRPAQRAQPVQPPAWRTRAGESAMLRASGLPRAAGAPLTSTRRTDMTTTSSRSSFDTQRALSVNGSEVWIHRLDLLGQELGVDLTRLPMTIKILLEAVLRNVDGHRVRGEDVERLARWDARSKPTFELPFLPARVVLQDFTGVPCVVDLAAMRDAMKALGGDPSRINPLVPVDLVCDHSVQVDFAGTPDALAKNAALEFTRNRERYEFLRWGQKSFRNFRVVPPATGIVHQVNLEYLSSVVRREERDGRAIALPDTLVGTDSHSTMVNGLGVLGWGVGGIEAEAAMLGQPTYMVAPEVVGFRLHGRLREGVTATDLVLTVTQMLRKKGVVEKFVEFYGDGLSALATADRATVANMAPEYGATCGYFPVDAETLRYLRATNRAADADLTEAYCKAQGLFRVDGAPAPAFSDTIELDLSDVQPSIAGPKRPQDRVALTEVKRSFQASLSAPVKDRGYALAGADLARTVTLPAREGTATLGHGAVLIAAITSCTNTSNPSVMMAAGLLAQKAHARGLTVPAHVKTSLAPGSLVVTEYLRRAGVLPALEALGFSVVGYGCTTCIGNSGPLAPAVTAAVADSGVVTAAVLSGNRNFEGRVHPLTRANWLASPPLVVAYALAGTTDLDLTTEPLGRDAQGQPVFLKDVWPTQEEVSAALARSLDSDMFRDSYANVFDGNPTWNAVPTPAGELYAWRDTSTYIRNPPYFEGLTRTPAPVTDIVGARVLALFGDSVTTDHISPAGDIAEGGPAALYLNAHGIAKADFNSYGARRGNHEVMMRGTFANIRLKNGLVPGSEGNVTKHFPSGETMSIYDAAERYRATATPLVVLAGKEYGTGSSRDWAAKGPLLLGVRAAIAESFERIHRSNLVGMGVLPLVYTDGATAESLGLTGEETFDIAGIGGELVPRQVVRVAATRPDGTKTAFDAVIRLDTPVEIGYYRNGGILQTVLRALARGA